MHMLVCMTFVLVSRDCFGPAITDCYDSYCSAPEADYIIRLEC